MIGHVSIWSPEIALEKGAIFEFPENEKEKAVRRLQELDRKWGYSYKKRDYLNRYEHSDYVFVADLLQDVRNIHRLIYFDPFHQTWQRGCTPIPYIHLELIEQSVLKKDRDGHLLKDENGDYIPDDTKLNMGVKPPAFNGTHKLVFNYYWLRQYLKFLGNLFDDNEELTFDLSGSGKTGTHMKPSYGTQADVLKLAEKLEKDGLTKQADVLRLYAASSLENVRIQIPELTFIQEAGVQKHVGWSFFDEARNVITMDLKKGIYNTSGFAHLFGVRNALVSDIFIASLKMILAHETAHVARGHWNLRIHEPEFSLQRNVMMNCEINADWTAMKWLMNELLYATADNNPYSPVLAYTKKYLIYLWSIRVFAAYLSLSWGFREEDRVWSTQTVRQFKADREATHPIYQFRVACVLNHAHEHLMHMGNTCEKEKHELFTADGFRLNREFFQEVWNNCLNLINSFEVGIRSSWGEDTRTTLQKLNDSLYIEQNSRETDIHKIPFLLAFQREAQKELFEIEQDWPEIKKKLQQYGMYFPLDVS